MLLSLERIMSHPPAILAHITLSCLNRFKPSFFTKLKMSLRSRLKRRQPLFFKSFIIDAANAALLALHCVSRQHLLSAL